MSGTVSVTPRAGRSNSAKNGDAKASGCTAEHTSCKTSGNSKSAALRAPPPKVAWASTTCTFRPARAQMTAVASPLGPLPTTVTSTRQLQPIRYRREPACCVDRRQTCPINGCRLGRSGRGALG
ncbi:Uncharacterised protein [Mycobacterium tuberculosis]|nr:Uncharacterised protein [Mycobacterium tuberculosis]